MYESWKVLLSTEGGVLAKQYMLDNSLHEANASEPISFIHVPSVMPLSIEQPLKVALLIISNVFGIDADVKAEQPAKQLSPISFTDDGMLIEDRKEQFSKQD